MGMEILKDEAPFELVLADGVEKTMALEALQVSVEATAKAATVTGVLPLKSPAFIKVEQSSRCFSSGD